MASSPPFKRSHTGSRVSESSYSTQLEKEVDRLHFQLESCQSKLSASYNLHAQEKSHLEQRISRLEILLEQSQAEAQHSSRSISEYGENLLDFSSKAQNNITALKTQQSETIKQFQSDISLLEDTCKELQQELESERSLSVSLQEKTIL
ncbi:hypothetical protein GEMRC1_012494 [Eukaryota sp. GEM-RC1]